MSTIDEKLDTLLTNYLHQISSQPLKEFLWDNKGGLLRAAQMLRHLRDNDGECLGDHPDWIRKIDAILSGLCA